LPQETRLLSADQLLLTTLVVRLAVVATLATMLVRFRLFRRILLTERRDWPERLTFAVALGVPLAVGVVSRLLLHYDAADFTLAGPFLAGLIAGPYAGALVGVMVGLPATAGGEVLSLPFNVGCGFAGGGLREVCPKEAIWHFSPFVFTDLHRYAWSILRRFRIDWQIILIAAPVALELLRQFLGMRFGRTRLYFLGDGTATMTVVVMLATMLCVAIPIKIWNSARIEHKLQEQEQLLLAARIDALANQINPHFLFNTLNSIGSLIRSQPETARVLIVKLSGLLRRLLKSQDHFVTLREELSAVDEYLDIECIRFGPRLKIVKDIAPDCFESVVPSMLLQPLVENALKHGLARKVGAATLVLRSFRQDRHTVVEVEDDGIGIGADGSGDDAGAGIGLRNVNERLHVVYGANYSVGLHSVPGEGTRARVEIPDLVLPEKVTA
jgi:two-component system, LytTR family, sensor kinase